MQSTKCNRGRTSLLKATVVIHTDHTRRDTNDEETYVVRVPIQTPSNEHLVIEGGLVGDIIANSKLHDTAMEHNAN